MFNLVLKIYGFWIMVLGKVLLEMGVLLVLNNEFIKIVCSVLIFLSEVLVVIFWLSGILKVVLSCVLIVLNVLWIKGLIII